MEDASFDWTTRFVIPASLRVRPTPAGALQLDGEAADATVEVARDSVSLWLAFARPQSAETVYAAAARERELDRDRFRERLKAWTEQGLLQSAAPGQGPAAPSRLGMFARAAEAYSANPGSVFPLRSPFSLQRPIIFYPGLDTREIHDGRRFPWVATLEGAFPVIQQELIRLLQTTPSFASVHRAHTSTGDWAAAYFWAFGQKVEATCRACPETARLLSAIPGVMQFGTTLFSALAPHTQIAPHYGFTNAKLRCQLPLRVPGSCKLKVGEQEVDQREGKCIVFDDSFLHSAWNDSAEPRYVLVFDFFHPDLTPAEVLFLARYAHQREIAKPYLADAAAGNRAEWASVAEGA